MYIDGEISDCSMVFWVSLELIIKSSSKNKIMKREARI